MIHLTTRNVGSRVVARLLALGARPRVFARDPEKALGRFGDASNGKRIDRARHPA
jgi:uncharacterized protein YbjT (DUF2867 family)